MIMNEITSVLKSLHFTGMSLVLALNYTGIFCGNFIPSSSSNSLDSHNIHVLFTSIGPH